jgi:hypothetical protein
MSKRINGGRRLFRGLIKAVDMTAGTVVRVGVGVAVEAYDEAKPHVVNMATKINELTTDDKGDKQKGDKN